MDGLKSPAALAHNEPCYFASQNKKITELPLSLKLLTQKIESLHQLLDINAPALHPFLRCALDVALHDLEAKKLGRRLNRCWNQPEPDRRVPTCYTIGLGSVEEMKAKIKNFPWPVYKIKLGTEDDLATIRALREVTDSPFRVDANTGWTAAQTLAYAPELTELGVEFIEQPLKVDDLAGQRLLFKESPLPILADESCQTLEDVDKCAGMFHGINVKVVKCGGLLKARKMIARAREFKLSIMAGCMTESSVGISAIAQLVPELDYVDIDGALLLAEDPAEGVTFDQEGIVQYPDRPGTGAVLRG
ncbi:dipeptide epimerase [Lewinellaceae bacterium SD302]|nr:dipeptide epimerase [Lewinellaceae bacterium SD302]